MSAAAGHAVSALVWAPSPVDIAQDAASKRATRTVFEIMKKQVGAGSGPFSVQNGMRRSGGIENSGRQRCGV
jgi:hypothetical protein